MRLVRKLLLSGGVIVFLGLPATEITSRLRPDSLPGWLRSYAWPHTADLLTLGPLADPEQNPDPDRLPRIEVVIDALGFPNPEVPESTDVVLVGDSFTVGASLRSWLEHATGLNVYSLGVPGVGPLREAYLAERVGLPLSPQVIVWFFFGGNDVLSADSHWSHVGQAAVFEPLLRSLEAIGVRRD